MKPTPFRITPRPKKEDSKVDFDKTKCKCSSIYQSGLCEYCASIIKKIYDR